MRAAVGDRLVIKGHHVGEPDRDAEILEVHGADGAPPYQVRWGDDGHEGLFFPGSDAEIEYFPRAVVRRIDAMTAIRAKRDAQPPRQQRSSSLRIARVAGIDIRLHFTFFLLVMLFAVGSTGPDGPGPMLGLVWLATIFTCVVVHELAHSLVARRRGGTVREIVLLPIGGVSKLENLPESPRDEFVIAIVGPLASASLAVAAALLTVAVGSPLLPVDLAGGPFLARLVWFNLVIAGFNLLPAFPLDGGRVFRALLERRYDLERATHLAARVGRSLAVALMAVGFWVNLWFLIIGIFVYFGASAEEVATAVHVRLRGVRVGDIMLLQPVTLDPSTRVADLRVLVRRTAQGAFPVVGVHGYEGMVDVSAIAAQPDDACVSDVARNIATLSPGSDVEADALPLLRDSPMPGLAVIEEARVVGLVRLEDVQHLLQRRDRQLIAGGGD